MKTLSRILYHNLTLFAIASLLWGTLAFPSPTPAQAATLTVNTLSDENDHSCSDGDCSLRDAIETAAPGDEIGFAAALGGGTIPLASTLEINKSLEISSTVPITVSGGDTVKVFSILPNVNVTLNNLHVVKGRNGISNQGNLTINNSTIANNNKGPYGYYQGGGVENRGVLTLNNSIVTNNRAHNGGGVFNSGTLTIHATSVSNNWALSEYGQPDGGGIYNIGQLIILDSTLNQNHSSGGIPEGGGLYNTGAMTISHTTFSQNSVYAEADGDSYGGGIFNSGTAWVDSSVFWTNGAGGRMACDPCYTSFLGGGIYNTGTINITNSTFSRNVADTGSAIFNGQSASIANSTFSENYNRPLHNAHSMSLANTIVANTFGGDCYNSGILIANVSNLIEDGSCNPALSGDPLLGEPTGSPAYFTLLPGSPAIDAGDGATCTAIDQRGVPRPQDGNNDGLAACDIGAVENHNDLRIGDVSLAEGDNGISYFQFTVSRYVSGGSCSIQWNTIDSDAVAPSDYIAANGIITFLEGEITKTITISVLGDTSSEPDETFFVKLSNPSQAIIVHGQATGTIQTDDPILLRVTRSGTGNGLVTSNPAGIMCGTDCDELYPQDATVTLEANAEPGYVFGHWNSNGNILSYDSHIALRLENVATRKVEALFCAPAIVTNLNDSGPGSLRQAIAEVQEGCTITFAADLDHGTIILSSTLTVNKNLHISGNIPITISGNNVIVFSIDEKKYVALSGIVITSGPASFQSNAVVIKPATTLSLKNCSIIKNPYGGIYNDGILTVESSSFIENGYRDGYVEGGGIHNAQTGTAIINNSTFANDHADGALYNRGKLTATNNTFTNNRGGGIFNSFGGVLSLQNNIIAGSVKEFDCTNWGVLASNVGNLIEDGSCTPALSGDPLLGEPTGSPAYFPLLPGSPAIDAGDGATCTAIDQRGAPRPQGPACDIGAVEMPTLEVTKQVSPGHNIPLHAPVTYTLTLSNYDPISPTQAFLTDTLPAAVDFGHWLHQPSGATQINDQVTWNGTLTPSTTISFTFTATHTGWFGDVVTNAVQVSATHQTATASAVFTVRTNATPIANPDTYPLIHTTPLSVPPSQGLLANDLDPDGDPLTATLLSTPLTGTLALQPDGAFVYTPTLGFIGPLTFTYAASDGFYTGTATVLLNVTKSADLAVSQQVTQSGTTITYTVTLSNLGPEDAGGALFHDQVSPFLTGIQWSCIASAGAACPSPAGSAGLFPAGSLFQQIIPALPPGSVITYTITGSVQAGSPSGNAATITPPSDVTDPNLSNNQSVVGTPYIVFLPLVTKDEYALR